MTRANLGRLCAILALIAWLPYVTRIAVLQAPPEFWLSALETVPYVVLGILAAVLAGRNAHSWPAVMICVAISLMILQVISVIHLSHAGFHPNAANPFFSVLDLKWDEVRAYARHGYLRLMVDAFNHFFAAPVIEALLVLLSLFAASRPLV